MSRQVNFSNEITSAILYIEGNKNKVDERK